MQEAGQLETGTARRRSLWHPVPMGLLIAMLLALAVDLPAAAHARQGKDPRWLVELLEVSETFGHGMGVAFIVIGVFILDPARRRYFPYLLAGSLGAGLIANLIKLLVIRTRPRNFESLPASVWDTFGGLWSLSQTSQSQSFPSAHTATAVGLAAMLSAYYPRGRWYFMTLGLLVGLQRIQCSAHFPSDVFAGAIVGWYTAVACLAMDAHRSDVSLEMALAREAADQV